ncbi:MAG: glycerate kinase [Vibrio sp.]
MKILIAPDSFKESLSAKQVAECIERGFREVFPTANYLQVPLADGGEGTVDVLLEGLNGTIQRSQVTGPYGERVTAQWALLDHGNTALIEIAAASGLDLVEANQRNPKVATTFGTGELIKQALDAGVSKIILGLGGSATNDGGAGIFQALGGKLLDAQGEPLALGGAALKQLAKIDNSGLHPRCATTEMILACDVDNPLIGEQGASFIFGQQKGADTQTIVQLDEALKHFADVTQANGGTSYHHQTSYGAAGGAPLGLSLAFPVTIKPGIEMVLDTLNMDAQLADVDLVITGEGQMDNQTIQGKTPYGIAKRAKARGIPVIGIAGSLGTQVEALYPHMNAVFATIRSPQALPQVLSEAQMNLVRNARNIAAVIQVGMGFK